MALRFIPPGLDMCGLSPFNGRGPTTPADCIAGMVDVVMEADDVTPPTLLSATVAANGLTFTLVFSEAVEANWSPGHALDHFIVTTSGASCTLSYSAGDSTNTIVVTLSAAAQVGDILTLAFDGLVSHAVADLAFPANYLEDFSGFPVTNNSTVPDTTPPTLVSATVAADGVTMTLVFSEAVTNVNWDDMLNMIITSSGEVPTASYTSGDATTTIESSLSKTVLAIDTLTFTWSSTVTDIALNPLAPLVDAPITNHSIQ